MSRILLVEGREDRETIYGICNAHDFNTKQAPQFTIEDKNGYEGVRQHLQVRPLTRDIETLAAVIDADLEVEDRWRSICKALDKCGYQNLPEAPSPDGTVIERQGRLPTIGIWMMPDNRRQGILEDFLHDLATTDNGLFPHATATVDGEPARVFSQTPRSPEALHTWRSKAIIHTWLAWQDAPGTPTGQALTKHYLDPHHPQALAFLAWLRRLFA